MEMESFNSNLGYMEYVNRENAFVHPTFSEDMLQYVYLKNGDPKAVEEAIKNFDPEIQGKLSDNELRDVQYLFVAATTLACRHAIEGGMEQKKAFSASDMFIQQMDRLPDVKSVIDLHETMITYYLNEVIKEKKRRIATLPIVQCVNYIYDHLHEKITVKLLAEQLGLHPNYLSSMFKKETGRTITEYIQWKKIETACTMLKYSRYSVSEISNALNFSSQSYFIQVFRKEMGVTPKTYRNQSLMS